MRGSQRREGQRHPRHERLHSGLRYADSPSLLFFQSGRAWKERCGVTVGTKTHQHKIEQRPFGVEAIGAVKALELLFVKTRGAFGVLYIRRNGMNVSSRRGRPIEQNALGGPHIAQRIALRDEPVVADEPVHAIPRHFAAPRALREQPIEPEWARTAGQAY